MPRKYPHGITKQNILPTKRNRVQSSASIYAMISSNQITNLFLSRKEIEDEYTAKGKSLPKDRKYQPKRLTKVKPQSKGNSPDVKQEEVSHSKSRSRSRSSDYKENTRDKKKKEVKKRTPTQSSPQRKFRGRKKSYDSDDYFDVVDFDFKNPVNKKEILAENKKNFFKQQTVSKSKVAHDHNKSTPPAAVQSRQDHKSSHSKPSKNVGNPSEKARKSNKQSSRSVKLIVLEDSMDIKIEEN